MKLIISPHNVTLTKAIEDHLPIDVTDYEHVPDGPGTVLITHEANFSMDATAGRPGLLYQRKQPLPGDFKDRLATTLRHTLLAAARLETHPGLKFRTDELTIKIADRLLAPNTSETFATQKPTLIDWVQENQTAAGDWTIYVDSDLFFFGSLAGLLAGLADTSIALSPHRFNPGTEHLSAYGDYNAGFGIWRNDAEGRRCLREWRDDCLAWCFNRAEGGRFMNQGYLTDWPARYRRAAVLRHPGVNLAPWNIGSHRLRLDDSTVLVDEHPLQCFHFSSLSRTPTGDWQTFYTYDAMHEPAVQTGIYAPYLQSLERVSRELSATHAFPVLDSLRAADPDIPMLTMRARA